MEHLVKGCEDIEETIVLRYPIVINVYTGCLVNIARLEGCEIFLKVKVFYNIAAFRRKG